MSRGIFGFLADFCGNVYLSMALPQDLFYGLMRAFLGLARGVRQPRTAKTTTCDDIESPYALGAPCRLKPLPNRRMLCAYGESFCGEANVDAKFITWFSKDPEQAQEGTPKVGRSHFPAYAAYLVWRSDSCGGSG